MIGYELDMLKEFVVFVLVLENGIIFNVSMYKCIKLIKCVYGIYFKIFFKVLILVVL